MRLLLNMGEKTNGVNVCRKARFAKGEKRDWEFFYFFSSGESLQPVFSTKKCRSKKKMKRERVAESLYIELYGKNPRGLDQFFTEDSVAENLVFTHIAPMISDFDEIMEPSCGNGGFLRALQNLQAHDDLHFRVSFMDIDAKMDCQRGDFLQFVPPFGKKFLVLGNPPFGKNASKAIDFFNHAATFAECIAFILPKTFRKDSVKNRLALNFVLSLDVDVPENSFIYNGGKKDVTCCFQIWKRLPDGLERKKINSLKSTSDFVFVRNTEEPDFAIRRVGVNAGRLYFNKTEVNMLSPSSHLFCKFRNPENKKAVQQRLMSLKLEESKEKGNVAGNPSLSKSEICKIYMSQ